MNDLTFHAVTGGMVHSGPLAECAECVAALRPPEHVESVPCPACQGSGEIVVPAPHPANETSFPCSRCYGTGEVPPVVLDPAFEEEEEGDLP